MKFFSTDRKGFQLPLETPHAKKYSGFHFAICLGTRTVKYKYCLPIDYVYSVAKHVKRLMPSVESVSILLIGTKPGNFELGYLSEYNSPPSFKKTFSVNASKK